MQLFILLILLLSVVPNVLAQKIEIVRGAEMRVDGKYSFKARTEKTTAKKIVWTLDREEKSLDGETNLTKNVATTTGKRANFDLTAKADTETVYLVRAEVGNIKDEITLRVFPADAMSFFDYQSAGNPDVKTFVVAPPKIDKRTKIIVVMHGQLRGAVRYLESWREWASKNNYLAIAPQFDEANWKDSRSYNLGNLFTQGEAEGVIKPASQWTFTIVGDIFKKIRGEFGIADKKFDIWGHSAGGQFVHRFLFYKPDAPVRTAISANAGWYTTPELETAFPYGWKHPQFSFTETDLKRYTQIRLVIMRGTSDTGIDDQVRTTPEANRQGRNRFERAKFMFDTVKKINPRSPWQLIDVPGAAHEQQKMAAAAQTLLTEWRKRR